MPILVKFYSFIWYRAFDKETVGAQVKLAVELKKNYPDVMAGFDLVGQEDPGHPLIYFVDELLEPTINGQDLPYFFHAGETSKQIVL